MKTFSYVVGNQLVVKNINRTAILNIIREKRSISRIALTQMTKLSRSTISAIVSELIDEGLVQEISPEKSTGGRRPTLLKLAITDKIVGAVSIHTRTTNLAILDFDGNILRKSSIRTEANNPNDFLHECAIQLQQISHQFIGKKMTSVGVTVPGTVDIKDGIILRMVHLGWKNVPAREIIEKVLNTNIVVENEANAIALSESFFKLNLKDETNFAYVILSDEVGTGIVLNNNLLRAESSGFEFAHTVIDRNGVACKCGSQGCWETCISNHALVREYNSLINAQKKRDPIKHSPQKVINVSARQVNAMVKLQWEYYEPDIWRYNIYRCEQADFEISSDTLIGSAPINSYFDNSVQPNTTYYYRISAIDHEDNEGEPSEPLAFHVKQVENIFFDDYSTNTTNHYIADGNVNLHWTEGILRLGDNKNDQNDMVIYQGNHGDCEIQATVKPAKAGIWDTIGVLAKVQDGENWYCGLIAYGVQLKEQHSLAFMRRRTVNGKRDEQWLAFYPFSVEMGKEYIIKISIAGDYLNLKAWKKGEPEPESWQLSIIEDSGWQSGGVGIRHFGLSAEVHSLSIVNILSSLSYNRNAKDDKLSDAEQEVRMIVTKAKYGNEIAVEAIRRTAQWIGLGLANVINVVGVKTIVLAGPITEAWDIMQPEIKQEIKQRLLVMDPVKIKIIPIPLNDNTSIWGAGSLGAKEIFHGYRCVR